MTCPHQKQASRLSARGKKHHPQLPPLWQESILQNARDEAERADKARRRRTLSFSIAASLVAGVVARPTAAHAATEHTDPITGVAENDRAGGSGNYVPGYDIVDQHGTLHYRFAGGDSVALEGVDSNVLAMSITSGNPPVVLDVAGGWLSLSASRPDSSVRGVAVGLLNDGNTVTVNGNTRISARARDADFGGGLGNGAHAVLARGGSTTVFNGATDLHAHTQGFARAVWVMGRSNVVFNGPTTILAESRGTLDAVYNSDGGTITFNGDTNISALSIWPSDNAHAIYNDNVNTRLTVNGNLSLTTVARGSTAFGVRNQGRMEVFGAATVNVEGPRSTHGIANTHRSARMRWHGDVDVRVRSEGPENGYVPFGNPSGLSNDRSPGAVMTFDGAVSVDVASEAETYGLASTGLIEFTSPTAPVSFTVASTSSCSACNVYGIRNFGTVNAAGGLTVSTSPSKSGAAYSIWSVPLDIQNASVTVNQAGGQRVQLDGDIAIATDPVNGNTGSVSVRFDTADSWLRGLVGGVQNDAGYSVGRADLTFSNGATWIPQGAGTLSNDFGTGTLSLRNGGGIDMAGYWGSFLPASVPSHTYRRLIVDSSNTGTGGTVALGDGAGFLLLSDITGKNGPATADQIVFGSGIRNFSATGTQGVGIVYDPVLDDTSWINAAAIRDGISIPATSPIDIVDASAAAGGSATFSAVTGLNREWSGTYENDLVKFVYSPLVALSADRKKILLTGIAIHGAGGSGSGGDDGVGDGSADDGSGDDGGGEDTGTGNDTGIDTGIDIGGGASGILPSETVQTAADAADSLVNLWRISGQASLQRPRGQLRNAGSDQSNAWARVDAGELTANTAYSRRYRQNHHGVAVGADRSFALGNASSSLGYSAGHVRSTARYAQGKGELTATTLGLYGSWNADSGAYLLLGASASSLENRYSARDSQGRNIGGRYRTEAGQVYAEGGYPFKLGNGYYIEPQLGLAAGTLSGSRHATANGVLINQDKLDTSYARAGVAVGRTLLGTRLQGHAYARASALHYLGDNLDITASKDGGSIAPDTADRTGTGGEFTLGADVNLGSKRTGLFFEASAASGLEVKQHWGVQLGLRHSW